MVRDLGEDFKAASDKTSYDKYNLPEDLKKRVTEMERRCEESKERMRDEQAERRDQEIQDARDLLRLLHANKNFDMPGPDGKRIRLTEDQINRTATDEVDRSHRQELEEVEFMRDAKIAGVIALGEARKSQDKGETPKQPAADYYPDIGGEFYRAAEPDRGGPSL